MSAMIVAIACRAGIGIVIDKIPAFHIIDKAIAVIVHIRLTEIFVSVGSGLSGPAADPARVVGQVITGVGFLGAGVIMGKENLVKGVTSAAVIWILAAIGTVIGIGYLVTAMAFTLVTLLVLLGVEYLESTFKKLRQGVHAQYHHDGGKWWKKGSERFEED